MHQEGLQSGLSGPVSQLHQSTDQTLLSSNLQQPGTETVSRRQLTRGKVLPMESEIAQALDKDNAVGLDIVTLKSTGLT